jgi:hypothetical protein
MARPVGPARTGAEEEAAGVTCRPRHPPTRSPRSPTDGWKPASSGRSRCRTVGLRVAACWMSLGWTISTSRSIRACSSPDWSTGPGPNLRLATRSRDRVSSIRGSPISRRSSRRAARSSDLGRSCWTGSSRCAGGHTSRGGTVWTFEGAQRLRPATDADRDLPVMGTWGYSVIQLLAEERFVGPASANWMVEMELAAHRRSRHR